MNGYLLDAHVLLCLHRNPFDRTQVVQALREDCLLMTWGCQVQQYGVPCGLTMTSNVL